MENLNKPLNSQKKSNNEKFIQIYLPLIISFIVVVIVSFLVIQVSNSSTQTTAHWANISAVTLIVPMFFTILLFLTLLILIIFGLSKLIKWAHIIFAKIYVFFMRIAIFIINISNKIVSPVINSRAKLFSIKTLWKKG